MQRGNYFEDRLYSLTYNGERMKSIIGVAAYKTLRHVFPISALIFPRHSVLCNL